MHPKGRRSEGDCHKPPTLYTAHVVWARASSCPVYTASEDESWVTTVLAHRQLVTDAETTIFDTGITAIKVGGHFPGSMVLLYDRHVFFFADTVMLALAGVGDYDNDVLGV